VSSLIKGPSLTRSISREKLGPRRPYISHGKRRLKKTQTWGEGPTFWSLNSNALQIHERVMVDPVLVVSMREGNAANRTGLWEEGSSKRRKKTCIDRS